MPSLPSMLVTTLLLLLVLSGAIFADRRLTSERCQLKAHLVFDDFRIAALLAAGIVTLMAVVPTGWAIAVACVIIAMTFLWWCNSLLFNATGFTLSLDNVRAATEGWQTIWADAPHVFRTTHHKLWSLGGAWAVAISLLLVAGVGEGKSVSHWLIGLTVAGLGAAVSKSRLNLKTIIPWSGVVALVAAAAWWLDARAIGTGWVLIGAPMVLGLAIWRGARRFGSAFWGRRSPLRNLLVCRGLQAWPETFGFRLNIRPPEPLAALVPTPLAGTCAGQSVLFVVLESLASHAIDESLRSGGRRFPFFCGLAKQGLFSLHQYAISPNTNQSFEYLYRGGYPGDASYPYVSAMRRAGYRTMLLTTQNLDDFERFKIVDRIGFDHVIDRKASYFDPTLQDSNLFRQVDQVAALLRQGKSFIHVMNNQTHSPYVVLDQSRFGDTSRMGRKERYLAALDEMDALFAEWFRQLGELVDLRKVLIVISGDHGQSFGELGYDMHSSSTIKEQVKVPLWIIHPQVSEAVAGQPKLTSAWARRGSNLDLLPTVCDLVGVFPSEPVRGRCLFDSERPTDLFLHSEVRVRGIPAQMSLLRGNEKWMTDLINGVSYRMDDNDRVERVLSPAEELELHATLGATLQRLGFYG